MDVKAKKTSEKNKRNKTSEIKQAKKTYQNKDKIIEFMKDKGELKTSDIANIVD